MFALPSCSQRNPQGPKERPEAQPAFPATKLRESSVQNSGSCSVTPSFSESRGSPLLHPTQHLTLGHKTLSLLPPSHSTIQLHTPHTIPTLHFCSQYAACPINGSHLLCGSKMWSTLNVGLLNLLEGQQKNRNSWQGAGGESGR